MASPKRLPSLLFAGLAALVIAVAILVGAAAGGSSVDDAQAVAKRAKVGISAKRALTVKRNRCFTKRQAARQTRLKRRNLHRQARRLRIRVMRRCKGKPKATASGGPLYWGASIGEQLTGEQAPWDMGAVSSFESLAGGKSLSLVHFFSPFADCRPDCSFYKFPTGVMDSIREHGAIPFFSWSSQSTPSQLSEPDFQLGDVVSGSHDSYIRSFAEEVKEWNHPFFLRFNWEMNGNWFPWAEGVNGNQPGEYVAAWRHVHDIFAQVGATNVTWTWCPNVDPEGKYTDLASLYPGDSYVDWTCLDGYNWGTQPGAQATETSFSNLFGPSYREITESIAPSKPMVIGETGASERKGQKAKWIADMLAALPREFPKIRALIWFERYDDGMDWPIETSTAATQAFASGIENPVYRGNEFAGLSADPIEPPN